MHLTLWHKINDTNSTIYYMPAAHPINSLSLLACIHVQCASHTLTHTHRHKRVVLILVCHERRIDGTFVRSFFPVKLCNWNCSRTKYSQTLGHQKYIKKKKKKMKRSKNEAFVHPENGYIVIQFHCEKHWNRQLIKIIIADNFIIWFYCLCASFFRLIASFLFCFVCLVLCVFVCHAANEVVKVSI